MASIFEVIQTVCEKLSKHEGYQRAWLDKHWKKIVGNVAYRHSMPRAIRNKILYINVDSSTWNQALFIEKQRLLHEINRCFSMNIVVDLKFQMGNDTEFSLAERNHEMVELTEVVTRTQGLKQTKILTVLLQKKSNAKK